MKITVASRTWLECKVSRDVQIEHEKQGIVDS